MMHAALAGQISGPVATDEGAVVFKVRPAQETEPELMVRAGGLLGEYISGEAIGPGTSVLVMGQVTQEEGTYFIKADRIALDLFSEWKLANGH